jgi:hypothetical protein
VRAVLAGLGASFATSPLPPFVGEAIQRQLAEEPPASDRAPGLSHNDVNPTNLAYDGERLLLLDWDTAGTNDPLHDLAAISVFLRMDDATCRALLAAHDGAPVAVLPPGFGYHRRLVAVLCGAFFLHLARQLGHTGASDHTLDSAPSLVDIYQQLRSGSLSLASGQGRLLFGLALLKESFAL